MTKRVTSIGGQALLEGIMMVGPKKNTAAFCDAEGRITTEDITAPSLREKYPILKKPFLRGVFALIDTMRLGMKALTLSADKAGLEDETEEPSKFEKWLDKTFGDKIMNVVVAVGGVLGVALAVVLFFLLPTVLFNWIDTVAGDWFSGWRSVFEGVLRILIFVGYILLVSRMPDIDRTFRYHGAEHKTIFCYENELALTVENVRKQRRFHPRCGSSFMIIMLLLGIIIGFFIPFENPFLRTACKLLCLPVIVSIGYELIKLCGRHDNVLTKIIAAPGLWLQRLTVKEPDDKMIEAAIAAMEAVIPENGEDLVQ
ncbi:DUF1385 domain-containing protein [Anaeromassilibacillus senegalensis]|uniref:DUF1385 domain-containing protein n=1 Tax=Anaeromassilibacillus senegalensis TaxID=1673717 RepID=A0ABS9CQM9_9FIRM|nr:DUF1385 domain-containing protein [Anaeromassilibacillus senegalensis]MCF2652666.1 DUF1385 domain-containing protein [Anaeromassilibacillus senegalensis]